MICCGYLALAPSGDWFPSMMLRANVACPRRKVVVLYEHGEDLKPFGSAYIRLIRPLTHPAIGDDLDVSFALEYGGQDADAVIVDRLWRPDITPEMAVRLVKSVHQAGTKLIYALDDDLLGAENLRAGQADGPLKQAVEVFLTRSDGVLVATEQLRANCLEYNARVAVVANALDERLLVRRRWPQDRRLFPARRKVIGYMGTFSHDADLLLISEALEEVCARRHDTELQIIGAVRDVRVFDRLPHLPVRVLPVAPREVEYPHFMLWLTSRVWWDIGIAPLRDTAFNRCKSDIKLLDYSAMGAAGVFSRVGPYLPSVSHQQTGWLAGDDVQLWVEALETLLEDDPGRVEVAANARRYLYSRRTLNHCAPEWFRALDYLLQS